MTQETAQLIILIISGCGAVAWISSLVRCLRIVRGNRATQEEEYREVLPDSDGQDSLTNSFLVSGSRDEVAEELTHRLLNTYGHLLRIDESTSERVTFRKRGALILNQAPAMYFSRGEIRFENAPGKGTRVSYTVDLSGLKKKVSRISLVLTLCVGLPLLVGVPLLLWLLAAPHKEPAVRYQVFQTFQIVHGLWPPYLVMSFYKRGRREVGDGFDNLIGNWARVTQRLIEE